MSLKLVVDNGNKFRAPSNMSEEERAILENIKRRRRQEAKHMEDIIEILGTKIAVRETIWPEQLKLLKEAFEAHDSENREKCRAALKEYLEYDESGDIFRMDVSKWSYRHIMRWFRMLTLTGLCDELEESSVWIFFQVINYRAIKQMPPKSNYEFREKLKKFSPELFTFITFPSDEEDAIKCIA